jgi:hypothetical protein
MTPYAKLDAVKAETVREIAEHIVRSAAAALTQRTRMFARNSGAPRCQDMLLLPITAPRPQKRFT